ncbi:hypothetical protein FGIG_09540 [Fasciola gigantica]|uniref:BZIP domain-containing protein n=1 Tax=Fasciola gigantica TaxID=46835 RepID=A0A504Y6J0_FASGI|nr:hypothetical protein FGIG_09540 [Fasciola gigantica]
MDYTVSKVIPNPFVKFNSASKPSNVCYTPTLNVISDVEDKARRGVTGRSDSQMLRRRVTNREASFRYRQKLKHKTCQLQEELNAAFAAYQNAKEAYERAEHAFDVTEKLISDLVKRHNCLHV